MAGSTNQSPQAFTERRSYARRKMLKSVGISYGTEYCSTNAVLRNISGIGGFVDFKDGIMVPDNFRIYNEFDGYKVNCAVVRRSGNSAGFVFTGPAETHSNVKKQVVGESQKVAANKAPVIRMSSERRPASEQEVVRYDVRSTPKPRTVFGKRN